VLPSGDVLLHYFEKHKMNAISNKDILQECKICSEKSKNSAEKKERKETV
jgi:hypothetical protein